MAEERLPLFQTRRLETRHFAAQEIIDKNNAKKKRKNRPFRRNVMKSVAPVGAPVMRVGC